MMHADELPPAITALAPPSLHAIIDVEKSFRKAIAGYILLEQTASSLKNDMATLSPRQILLRSKQLSGIQQDLTSDDNQLIAIMNLAGREILHETFIQEYHQILADVMAICDRIWEQASLIKKMLSEQIDNTQNS